MNLFAATRLWRFLLGAFFALWMIVPRPAFAESTAPVAMPPRDVPIVLQPAGVKLPPVPATYQQQDVGFMHIAYVASAHERVAPLLRDAEEFKAKLTDELGQPVLQRVEVRIARTPEEMASLAPAEVPPPDYASGVAYPSLHLVLLTLSAPRTNEAVDLEEVFRHELAHVALEDAVLGRHVPRWFNEGLAVYQSGEGSMVRTRTLWDATLSDNVLPLADLDRGFPEDHYEVSIAYAESADFVRFLMREPDRARFTALIERTKNGQDFDRALGDAYGSDLKKLEFQWREQLSKRFTYLPVLTGGSLVWVLVICALGVGWYKRRRRARETLERWGREEAELDAAIGVASRAEAAAADDGPEHISVPRLKGLPKVEHDGFWHTLH